MSESIYPQQGSAFGLSASPSFPSLEQRILDFWDTDDTFRASVEARDAGTNGENEFVFYDGPPFANGLPHYGHLLTSYVKDVVPRYQTMRGKKVERRFGWDTHGLPAELEAMKQLGLKTKDEILEMGVGTFNEAARASVLRYTDEWQDYVNRMGRWVDFENDYKTLSPTFMESVLWVFKTLFDRGLIYEGYRVLPYCWSDETPLSNHELRMDDDVYKLRQDPSVTIGYKLSEPDADGNDEWVLIWTTTPWTVPSNQAVAVHPETDYVAVRPGADAPEEFAGKTFVLARALLAAHVRELGEEPQIVREYTGSDLVGRTYEPPFPYFEAKQSDYGEKMHTILSADFVTTDDGTGIVHQSPAFGEEDKLLTDEYGITAVRPVDDAGRFDHQVPDYRGQQVFDANREIVRDLKNHTGPMEGRSALLLRHETYDHSYPHCWRCRNPLIYRAVSSWFVSVTAIKETMLATNEEITWVPDNVKHGQFGTWLENARDWSITRNRFWGSPVPVWRSDDPEYPRIDVYGSFAELERDFGRLPVGDDGEPNLHRPYIDELTRPNPDDPTGTSTMRRVEDVLDVWFDSGSMPYGQVHYPFDNAEWFEKHYPADFIVEYIGQTRGWFYTLHILAAALFEKPAFRDVICHGIVLGSDGQKMSKSLRNYPDVSEVFDRDGSDAMRWFLMSSSILRGGNLVVTEQGIRDGVRQVLLPLWNTWQFFATYANTADGPAGPTSGYEAKDSLQSDQVLDRYLVAKTREFLDEFQTAMDAYDIWGACGLANSHLDMLTNWYVRRSRRRFWDGTEETHPTFDVFATSFEALLRAIAPLLPFATEEIWKSLTGGRSVHLADYPDAQAFPADEDLVAAMDFTRAVCSAGSALRKARSLRVRLPLSGLVLVTDLAMGEEFTSIIADELNVKSVRVLGTAEARDAGFSFERRLTVNARAAGPRLGRDVQLAIRGSKTGDWSVEDGVVTSGGFALVEGEYALEEHAESASESLALAPVEGGFIALDTALNDELEAEGTARDAIRAIQGVRKQLALHVSDRIRATLYAPEAVGTALTAHRELVAGEVLAEALDVAGSDAAGADATTVRELGEGVSVRVVRA